MPNLTGDKQPMVPLVYGTGLWFMNCCACEWKDTVFHGSQIKKENDGYAKIVGSEEDQRYT